MININVTLLIQIVNFVILLVILNAILYKPVMAKMRERADRVRRDREMTGELEQKVEDQHRRHQEELANMRQTAAQEKSALIQQAKNKEGEILAEARKTAAGIVDDMKMSIRKEAEEARKSLKADMTPLAQSVAEKILGRAV